jgi:hypothetical protein
MSAGFYFAAADEDATEDFFALCPFFGGIFVGIDLLGVWFLDGTMNPYV